MAQALISSEGLHFGASDLQFWEDVFLLDRCSALYDQAQVLEF